MDFTTRFIVLVSVDCESLKTRRKYNVNNREQTGSQADWAQISALTFHDLGLEVSTQTLFPHLCDSKNWPTPNDCGEDYIYPKHTQVLQKVHRKWNGKKCFNAKKF